MVGQLKQTYRHYIEGLGVSRLFYGEIYEVLADIKRKSCGFDTAGEVLLDIYAYFYFCTCGIDDDSFALFSKEAETFLDSSELNFLRCRVSVPDENCFQITECL